MSADSPSSRGGAPRFSCSWSTLNDAAAIAEASGRLDADAAAELAAVLDDALSHARLVLLTLRDASAVDGDGLDAIISRSVRARQSGSRLLVIAAPPHAHDALRRAGVEALTLSPETPPRTSGPPANPVNARIVPGRVMALEEPGVWLHGSDGRIYRAWVPGDVQPLLGAGTWVDVFLDDHDRLNGWYEAGTGLAINQRLAATDAPADEGHPVACQGPCGLVWQAAAPVNLIEKHERCLTCAGALVLA